MLHETQDPNVVLIRKLPCLRGEVEQMTRGEVLAHARILMNFHIWKIET